MMKLVCFSVLLICLSSCVFAQQHTHVVANADLDSLVKRNQVSNQLQNGINGYRIQIFFGTERKQANDMRTKFLQLYPNHEAYLIYQQPNFKVRVGDYRTQLEAQVMYRELLNLFDKVFIVPDKINLPKL